MRHTTESGRATAVVSVVLLLASAIGACASAVPQSMRPDAETAVKSGKGSQVYLRLFSGDVVEGELIAVSKETFWILGRELHTVPTRSIEMAAAGVFRTEGAGYGVWTAFGAVSTISHGGFLIFTLPMWLAIGIPLASYEAGRGEIEGSYNESAEAFRPYSRFPQGLPPGVDGATLRGLKPPPPPPVPPPPVTPPPVTPPPVDAAARLDPATPGV